VTPTVKRIAPHSPRPHRRVVFVEADRLGQRVTHGRDSSSLPASEARELGFALLTAADHADGRA
jgi:hypothetical protein